VRVILVIERKHLFPHLSPRGYLPPDSVDLNALQSHLFFAERDYMETNSHYKQVIPYLILQRGQADERRVLAYQRRVQHSEARLGGLWSVGFGGHIEPMDRSEASVATLGLVQAAANRELVEETGLEIKNDMMQRVGFINSDHEDVSSVHFGVVFLVDLENHPGDDIEIKQTISRQAEPYQAQWIPTSHLTEMLGPRQGPDNGTFEDWSVIAATGIYAPGK
jgi:predicted NUDIX family phosphoesterase